MNAPVNSRPVVNPFLAPILPTLADVCQQIAGSGLPETRERDYLWACRRISKLLGAPLGSVIADPKVLREHMETISPALAKLAPKTRANLRYNLLGALDAAGLSRVLKTAEIRLTDEWQALTRSLPDRRFREGLSRLARFCSRNGVEPHQVSSEIIALFRDAVDAGSFKTKADVMAKDTVTLWNRLVQLQADQGLSELEWGSRRKPSTRVNLNALPATFRQDVEAYLTWALGKDLFDPNSRVRPLASKTGRLRRQQIQSAVTSLVASGTPHEEITSLARLVTPQAVRSILRNRYEKVGRAPNAANIGIAKALVSIARERVKVDEPTLQELKALLKKLPPLPRGLTEKNKAFLRHFDDPETLPRLYSVPDQLWGKVKDQPVTEKSLADAQAAVAIAVLFYDPLRIANLAALEIGRTLILPVHKNGHAIIEIPAHETKNRHPHRVALPHSATELIMKFEKAFLRVLGSKFLFDSGKGRLKREATVSGLIERKIRSYMGFKMTEHQFRHLAAKVILDEEPGAYPVLSQLLGHASLKTAMQFYAELDTKRAARHHAALLDRALNRLKAEQGTPALPRRVAKAQYKKPGGK